MRVKLMVSLVSISFLLAASRYPAAAQKPTAHPLEGTWKLNAAQSVFAPNDATAPKEETMVFRLVGDQIELTTSGIQKDGAAIAGKYSCPKNGGEFKSLQSASAPGESAVETMIEPGNRFLTSTKNGKQIEVQHLVISKDGKTMSISDHGTDAKGKSYKSVRAYDKQ
jgi:hypothetical protein